MKKSIKANLNYSIILISVLEIAVLGLFIHSFFGDFYILWTLFLGASLVFLLVALIISYQTVELTKDGFTIKCFVFTIVKKEWNQIAKIDLLEIDSLYSHYGNIKSKWIVLYTDTSEIVKEGGANWKNSPWTIKGTPENIQIFKEFAPSKIVSF